MDGWLPRKHQNITVYIQITHTRLDPKRYFVLLLWKYPAINCNSYIDLSEFHVLWDVVFNHFKFKLIILHNRKAAKEQEGLFRGNQINIDSLYCISVCIMPMKHNTSTMHSNKNVNMVEYLGCVCMWLHGNSSMCVSLKHSLFSWLYYVTSTKEASGC